MFIGYEDCWAHDSSPIHEWRWLQPTVIGLVIQSIYEGKVDITKYPVNDINMPIRYYGKDSLIFRKPI